MSLKLTALILASAASLHIGFAQAAEELGRLFLTPEQRIELEQKRQAGFKEAPPPPAAVVREAPPPPAAAPAPSEPVTLNGFVSRSGGHTTAWINGAPQHDALKSEDPGRVQLRTEKAPRVAVKVGQTYNQETREVRDGMAGGEILIKRQ